jgi:translation initiation factor IF-1
MPDSSNKQFNFKVNKKGFIETQGIIEEALPSAIFRVILENNHQILARLSGKMRIHRIMLMPGDRVKIEMSQYDLTKGRITYRL